MNASKALTCVMLDNIRSFSLDATDVFGFMGAVRGGIRSVGVRLSDYVSSKERFTFLN